MALRMTPCPQCGSRTLSRVTEDVIRAAALPMGYVDVKVCAVDADSILQRDSLLQAHDGTLRVRRRHDERIG